MRKFRLLESISLQNKNWLRVQDFVYKTLRLVRISLLIMTVTKSLRFFSEELFYKSHRKLFSCACIAWYKHSRDWENSGQLCKPSTSSLVSITVSNSPNPSRVYIRLCKHEKRFLLLKYYLVSHTNNNLSFPFPYGQTLNCKELLVPGGGGTPIQYVYGYVPPNGVVILKFLI